MTDAQTEARAIALAAAGQVHDNEDARCVETLVERLVATALAAKDAELVAVKAYSIEMLHRKDEQFERAERAEAQLAEANRALAKIERRTAPHPDDEPSDDTRDKRLAHAIARRAREARGGTDV